MITADQEEALISRLRHIAYASKSFDSAPDWREISRRDRRCLEMSVGVRVYGTLEGTSIRLKTPGSAWERDVYGHIEIYDPVIRRSLRILPIEWRPLHPHDNTGNAPEELRYLTLWDRFHPFELNATLDIGVFCQDTRGIAAPLPDINSYADYLDFCAETWNCNDMLMAPAPPWREDLL